ncbi:ATP-binding cassette subfamily B protein [Peptoniphilus gorbachii]|uniref:ATP-binding cassette subfamily B protein n=1 Tax=Peptoniphilus gorbachii TaxID=411567 RepID=A0ABS2MK60_9FIRM|nr:ATP-binding cassette subfamily B protein [Peptoniphilus gorbachii]
MNLIKQYVSKRKGSYFASVLLAIVGVVAGFFPIYTWQKSL